MIKHGEAPFLECSSHGDKRFSAFCAMVNDKSIEEQYQAFKIFEDGSTGLHWRKAKGRKAVNQVEADAYYKTLWQIYILMRPELVQVLIDATGLSDKFGQTGHMCQATVLWDLRNAVMRLRSFDGPFGIDSNFGDGNE